ncbi:hypothetical protein DEJ50_04665 [Streptomyces venezuelae]|uniref:IrrE N-terminal-like domain-containing protein n=1 Tax=Streptomyces venezuelae TaxID=54571 RepID=A0A5P2CY78_STRVZ|nr:hypothetical protein [Streptomyces venezuelae]QES47230.1 hypothetical protein DEJ50_04665 [Streptomyces venezuelae]
MQREDWRRLRAQYEELLRRYQVPHPFRVEDLSAAVAAERGRPLSLLPMPDGLPTNTGICGMWVSMGARDLVYYTPVTSRTHQTHIILHELAHILLDHREPSVPQPEMLAQLFPDLDPAMATRLLGRGRTKAGTRQEQEAELLASVMWQHFNVAPVAVPTATTDTADVLGRVLGSFTGRGGRGRRR